MYFIRDFVYKMTNGQYDNERFSAKLLQLLLVPALIVCTFFFIKSLERGASGFHVFRQSQTAITARYLDSFLDIFSYKTPVLGAPWAIPFEFPTYQGIGAFIAAIFPQVSLDTILLSVSWSFYIITCFPLFYIVKYYSDSKNNALLSVVLFLLSPLYVYWGSTVMIESTALFFLITFWAVIIKLVEKFSFSLYCSAFVLGALGALTKVTTAFTFFLIAALHVLYYVYKNRSFFTKAIVLYIPFALSTILVMLWTKHTDVLKMLNMHATKLTSSNLTTWNFGSLAQKLNFDLWLKFFDRSIPEIIGQTWIIFFIAFFFLYAKSKYKIIILVSLLAFLLPEIVFTNLHFVHNYYQYASGVFLIIALSSSVVGFLERFSYMFSSTLLSVLIMIFIFSAFQNINYTFSHHKAVKTAKILNEHTEDNSCTLVLGADWSSATHYFSHTMGLAYHGWLNLSAEEVLDMYLEKQELVCGSAPLKNIVVYKNKRAEKYTHDLIHNKLSEIKDSNYNKIETEHANFYILSQNTAKQQTFIPTLP